jgi:hypothetical protein
MNVIAELTLSKHMMAVWLNDPGDLRTVCFNKDKQ